MASADFSIDATPVPAAVSVAYGATVNLAVLNLTGVKTITWRIAGSSNPSLSNPTITPAGSPSGATATFTQVSDPGTGLGASFLIECTVTDSTGATDVAYGVAGTYNASGYIPLASGEQTARHATHGWTAAVNQALYGVPRDEVGRPFFADACSSSNETLSGDPSPVDGETLSTGDLILLFNQMDSKENGPWIVNTAGAWSRPIGFETGDQAQGAMVQVLAGTVYEYTYWITRSNAVIGTDAIVFAPLCDVIIARGSFTYDFASIAAGGTAETIRTISAYTSLDATDKVDIWGPTSTVVTNGLIMASYYNSSSQIGLRLYNPTAGAVDLPSLTWYYKVTRRG